MDLAMRSLLAGEAGNRRKPKISGCNRKFHAIPGLTADRFGDTLIRRYLYLVAYSNSRARQANRGSNSDRGSRRRIPQKSEKSQCLRARRAGVRCRLLELASTLPHPNPMAVLFASATPENGAGEKRERLYNIEHSDNPREGIPTL
jgi:hypothetical protein